SASSPESVGRTASVQVVAHWGRLSAVPRTRVTVHGQERRGPRCYRLNGPRNERHTDHHKAGGRRHWPHLLGHLPAHGARRAADLDPQRPALRRARGRPLAREGRGVSAVNDELERAFWRLCLAEHSDGDSTVHQLRLTGLAGRTTSDDWRGLALLVGDVLQR